MVGLLLSILEYFKSLRLPVMVPWCLLFCIGIIFENYFNIYWPWLLAVLILLLILGAIFLKKPIVCSCILLLCAFFFGGLILAKANTVSSGHISYAIGPQSQKVFLTGSVISEPDMNVRRMSFLLASSEVSDGNISCRVHGKVLIRSSVAALFSYGDRLVAKGVLSEPYGPFASFLKNRQVYVVLSVKDHSAIQKTGRQVISWPVYFSLLIKEKIEKILEARLSPLSAIVLKAMILGEERSIPSWVRHAMVKVGTWHVMVVSGSNTGIVALISFLLLKGMRFPRKARYCLTIVILIIYCLATGASGPILRATVMAIVFILSYLIERNPLTFNALAMAACVILWFEPKQLFNIGFQLSFCSVFFIVWLYPKLNVFILRMIKRSVLPKNKPGINNYVIHALVTCFSVSLSAWIGTMPLLAHAFGQFSLLTVFANMIIVPFATIVVLGGFVLVLAVPVSSSLAYFVAEANDLLISLFVKMNLALAHVPFASITVPKIPSGLIFGYYLGVLLFCQWFFTKMDILGKLPSDK